MKETDHSW